MQANSPHPGLWQNLHGNVNPSGDCTSNNTDYHQKCFPPDSANLSYPGQSPTGNYFAQFSCTILQSPNDQIGTGSTQSTNEMKPAQENHFNSKNILPTEKQNSSIVLWTMPGSNVQIFVPGKNMQNISHCAPKPGAEAFNYNNMAYMQHKTTSTPAGPYTLQQFPTKNIINNKSLNETRRDLSLCISQHRQNHVNSTDNLPKSQSKKRMTLPSDTKHCPPIKNAHNGRISHHKLRMESSSTPVSWKAFSTYKDLQQNNAAKKAVAVVTPLSPIEPSPVNLLNKSAYALDARSVQMTGQNFPHPLGVSANVKAFGEPNDPTSKHQQPLSGEPSKDNDAAKSPVLTLKPTNQSKNTCSPNNADTIQNKSADQDESSEKIPVDNYTLTDKKTNTGESDGYFTIPEIEWSLDKLDMLIGFVQQIEDGRQRNITKTDPGKEILMLFWNGDVCKFHNAVQSKIYQNVMEEVFNYRQSKDDVILKQIISAARNQVAKDFHILQHDEVPPTMEYKSSWLNLNEKLDDIDGECGYSWHFKYPHSFSKEKVEHEEENSTCKSQQKSQYASETVTETIDEVPEVEQTPLNVKTLDKKSLHENVPVYPEFLLMTNHSTKLTDVVAEQTKCQPNKNLNASSKSTAKSDCAATDECEIASKSKEEAEQRNMEMDQIDTSASENNISLHQTISDIIQGANAVPQEIKHKISIDQFEEIAKSYGHSIQSADLLITGHNPCTTEIMSKVPKVKTCFELKENSLGNMRSLHENLHEQSNTETNCSPNPDVVTEQTNCQPNAINPLKAVTNLVRTPDGDQIVGEQQKCVSVFVGEKPPAKPENNCSLKCKRMDTEANITNPLTEKWFAGKITDNQDFKKDTDVLIYSNDVMEILDDVKDQVEVLNQSDDQIKVEVLDHCDDRVKVFFPEVHAKDVKPKEGNIVDVELESYCCLAKWFQSLQYGDGSWCMCQQKAEINEQKIKIKAHGTSLKVTSDGTILTNFPVLHTDMLNDAAMDKLKIVKDQPASEEMFKAENATSEQMRDESPSKCETDETLKHYEKDPSPDVKRRSGTICLSLYGSSSNRQGREKLSKTHKVCCEEPPKTIQITAGSLQKNDGTSKKRKQVELMDNDALDTRKRDIRSSLKNCDQSKTPQVHETKPTRVSEVTKENVLSSALTRELFNQCPRSRSCVYLADKNEQKNKRKSLGTQQISMNRYIIRKKTLPSKTLPSSEPVMKSKYELGNPALMPLQDNLGLDFKVLPSSFNFEDGAELNRFQADTLLGVQNDVSESKKAKRRKTCHAPTQGTWSFSPLKTKQHSTDVSGSCSLFHEFKKRYQDRKRKTASRQNLNSN